MKAEQLAIPVNLKQKTYYYHIDFLYYGQTAQDVLALHGTFHALEEGQGGVLGKFLAGMLKDDARRGSIFLAADSGPMVNEGVAGIWHYEEGQLIRVQEKRPFQVKNKTDFVIKNIKVYDGRNIRIAIGQRSIPELAANLAHEGTHHIFLASNHSISSYSHNADPTFYSEAYLRRFQQTFPEDMLNAANINDPKMREFAQYIFGRPDIYIKDVPVLQQRINELSNKLAAKTISPAELTELRHAQTELLKKPQLYRAEIAACLVEAEIRGPGALRIIAPKTSQVLYECLFNHPSFKNTPFLSNRTYGVAGRVLFSSPKQAFRPDLNDVTMPIGCKPDRFVPIYSSSLSNRHWRHQPQANNIQFNKLKPQSIFTPSFVTNIDDIVRFGKKKGTVLVDPEELDRYYFWQERPTAPKHTNQLHEVFKKNHPHLEPVKTNSKFAVPVSGAALRSGLTKSIGPGVGIGLNLFSAWHNILMATGLRKA